MYTIGHVLCKKTNDKYNIIKGVCYHAYRDAMTNETEIIIDDDKSIKLTDTEVNEYFKIY